MNIPRTLPPPQIIGEAQLTDDELQPLIRYLNGAAPPNPKLAHGPIQCIARHYTIEDDLLYHHNVIGEKHPLRQLVIPSS